MASIRDTLANLVEQYKAGDTPMANLMRGDTEGAKQSVANALQQATQDPYSGLNVLGTTKLVGKTAQELAHATAQKNAVEMLGLHPENTAMDRANALGFNIDYKHGTERLDRLLEKNSIDSKRATSGPMPYGTDSAAIASNYAKGKPDTSIEFNDIASAFQVSPKQLGLRGSNPYTVEQSWHYLPEETKADILDKYKRVGYANKDMAEGDYILHPPGTNGSIAGDEHLNYVLQNNKNNPLAALRDLWHDSGQLYGNEEDLNKIYQLSGYPHTISNSNAPFFSANGVLTGKANINRPLVTSNYEEINNIIPQLENAFKGDRTKLQQYGADSWAKDTRFTPKQWIEALKNDTAQGENSFVWTSIPDKVTKELKNLGYNGILDTGGKGGGQGHQVVIPFHPTQVRSQFAAFDPARTGEPDLLAGAMALPIATDKDKRNKIIDLLKNK